MFFSVFTNLGRPEMFFCMFEGCLPFLGVPWVHYGSHLEAMAILEQMNASLRMTAGQHGVLAVVRTSQFFMKNAKIP